MRIFHINLLCIKILFIKFLIAQRQYYTDMYNSIGTVKVNQTAIFRQERLSCNILSCVARVILLYDSL